ncbi:hypothetical protein GN956_G16205 [Arapaima gigas]
MTGGEGADRLRLRWSTQAFAEKNMAGTDRQRVLAKQTVLSSLKERNKSHTAISHSVSFLSVMKEHTKFPNSTVKE